MVLYDKKSIEIIKVRFRMFLGHKDISEKSIGQYISDFDFFTENYIVNQIAENEMDSFFSKTTIEAFLKVRLGNTASAMLRNLIEFMFSEGKITSDQYLKFNNNIVGKRTQVRETTFLLPSDVEYICSNGVIYRFEERDREAKIVGPIVWALNYYCYFEQAHIEALVIDDIKLKDNLIRNVRVDESPLAKEWIVIDKDLKGLLTKYMEYRKNIKVNTDKLIIYDGKPVTTGILNKMYDILNRVDNAKRISTNVNGQVIVRSRVLHQLMEQEGRNMASIVEIFGLEKNTQFLNATEEYLQLQKYKRRKIS